MKILYNANSGATTVESKNPLEPLRVTIEEPGRTFELDGNVLSISQRFEKSQELTELVEDIYFLIPALLSLGFADPPYVKRVEGTVGDVEFGWELDNWKGNIKVTTQQLQEATVSSSWKRMGLLSVQGRRRLVAALHYFYVAVRLSHESSIAGEFLPEVVLNYTKVLEVLFPPGTRDAVRTGLGDLGYSKDEIESDYLPAMALRAKIDVAHVHLSLINGEQLNVIHGYVAYAEAVFRGLLTRVLDQIEEGKFAVGHYEPKSGDPEVELIVNCLRQHAKRYRL